MQVTLLNYTPEALELLLFTKQTRLAMSPGLMDEIRAWPMDRKMKELDYMLGTIQSSWEFCDYTFLIDGVSRAFTHQLVRTRTGSYAQQSQRTVDMSGFEYVVPTQLRGGADDVDDPMRTQPVSAIDAVPAGDAITEYMDAMDRANDSYQRLRAMNVNPQDARGVLPTNICTNIVAKFTLRGLADMAKLRLCTRTQGEYQDVFRLMRAAVLAVHPWAEPFIRVHCAATGVCCFPNYKECPIKAGVYNPESGKRWDGTDAPALKPEEIQKVWEGTHFEAVPQQVKP